MSEIGRIIRKNNLRSEVDANEKGLRALRGVKKFINRDWDKLEETFDHTEIEKALSVIEELYDILEEENETYREEIGDRYA